MVQSRVAVGEAAIHILLFRIPVRNFYFALSERVRIFAIRKIRDYARSNSHILGLSMNRLARFVLLPTISFSKDTIL